MSRRRLSAGSMMSLVVSWPRLRVRLSPTRRAARQAGDIEAVDRGEVVIVRGAYHGDYGKYPHWRYLQCLLDLAPDRPVIRPMFLLGFRRRIPVEEPVLSARVRPFRNRREAKILLNSSRYSLEGPYSEWGPGCVIIACRTTGGTLEFLVLRPDVDLMLHYLGRLAASPGPQD